MGRTKSVSLSLITRSTNPPSPPTFPRDVPVKRPKGRGNLTGERITALAKFVEGRPPGFDAILTKTGVSKSGYYKLRSKAVSRGWMPGTVVEVEHVENAPRSGCPKTSTALRCLLFKQ